MLWFLVVLAYLGIFATPFIVAVTKHKNVVSASWWLLFGTLGFICLIIAQNIYADVLWFKEMGQGSRYWIEFWAKITSFLIGFLASLVFFCGNILVTSLKLPRSEKTKEELSLLHPASYLIAFVVALVFGGYSVSFWDQYLLYANQVPFKGIDPIFGKNDAFYVFTLPFLKMVANYLWFLLGLAIVGTIIIYQRGYAIFKWHRDKEGSHRTLNHAISHCSVLGVILAGIIIFTIKIASWNLLHSTRGAVIGAGWTDIHAQLPVYRIFIWVVAVSAALLLISALARSLRLTALFSGLALVVGVFFWLGGVIIWPAIRQHYKVSPNELEYEKPYIAYNIKCTREAFGLTNLKVKLFPVAESGITQALLENNRPTTSATRIWDWRVLDAIFQQMQSFRLYYFFRDVDILRYHLDGRYVQVMAALRELDSDRLASSAKTWQNMRFVYTHGYGACLTPVNGFVNNGFPDYWVKDIPPVSKYPEISITQPEIYFGEMTNSTVFVKTLHPEFDHPAGDTNAVCFYKGSGGVPLGKGLRKIILALHFDGIRLLTAKELTRDSRIMYYRNVKDRMARLAPFLVYDHDPCHIIAQGKIWYMADAYTTSNELPYSQRYAFNDEKFGPTVNYIRNSVKGVVDAYNGTVVFYVYDQEDPIIQTWRRIFPTLFSDKEGMPESLRAHVRYPEDYIHLQAEVYRTYHMTDVNVFYNREDMYDIATEIYGGDVREVLPYFVIMTIPGESSSDEFIQMIPFTPHTTDENSPKNNLVAWLAGRCDSKAYGDILVYEFPKDRLVTGPMQLEAKIKQDEFIRKDLALWNAQGSVIEANLLVIPISDFHLLYVKPFYLQTPEAKMPQLVRVVASDGERLGYATTFEGALDKLSGVSEVPEITEAITKPGTKDELLKMVYQYYTQYQQLIGQGKMVEAGRAYEELGNVLRQILPKK